MDAALLSLAARKYSICLSKRELGREPRTLARDEIGKSICWVGVFKTPGAAAKHLCGSEKDPEGSGSR